MPNGLRRRESSPLEFRFAYSPLSYEKKAIYASCASILLASTCLEVAPTCLSTTSPSLRTKTVGMLRMPYFIATSGLKSTFSLPTKTRPAYSLESSSIWGPIIRQGPHHSAQKSTTVNPFFSRTVSLKFPSVNSKASVRRSSCLPKRSHRSRQTGSQTS